MVVKGMRMSRRVLIKSRNRICGRRATEEEITREIASRSGRVRGPCAGTNFPAGAA